MYLWTRFCVFQLASNRLLFKSCLGDGFGAMFGNRRDTDLDY